MAQRVKLDAPDGPILLTHGDGSTDRLTVKDGYAELGEARLERVVNSLPVEVVTASAARAADKS